MLALVDKHLQTKPGGYELDEIINISEEIHKNISQRRFSQTADQCDKEYQ